MATILDTFITKFRYSVDNSGLREVEQNLSHFKQTAMATFASIAGLFSGGFFITKVAETTDKLGKMADSLGLPVQQLQMLEFAAQRAGVPVNALITSLQSVQRAIGEASRGYGVYGQVLARFGVSIRDSKGQLLSIVQVMHNLNRVFQGLNRQQQFDLAQNLGINPQTIPLLQQSVSAFKNVEDQAKSLGLITRENTRRAAEFEDAWTDIKTSLYALSVQIFSFTEPAMKALADSIVGFTKYLNTSSIGKFSVKLLTGVVSFLAFSKILKLVIGLLRALTVVSATSIGSVALFGKRILSVVGAVKKLSLFEGFGALISSIKSLVATGSAVKAFGEIWAGVQLAFTEFLIPIGAVILAFGGLALAVQDVWTYFRGGKSVTGELVKGIESVIHTIKQFYKVIYDFVVPAPLRWLLRMLFKLGGKIFKSKVQITKEIKEENKKEATGKRPTLTATEQKKQDDQLLLLARGIPIPTRALTNVSGKQTEKTAVVNNRSNIATSNKKVTVNVGGVNVNAQTNANPQDIAKQVNDTLAEKLKQSVNYFDSGIIL